MNRRKFLQLSGMGGVILSLPLSNLLIGCNDKQVHSKEYRRLTYDLLKDWCDGMIDVQVINPSDPKVHGMLNCPSCSIVHTRLMDAVYPFLYMAKASGDSKYLHAGIALMEWGDNVSRQDGAWTNELKPNSWDGITVFGAIALAEALHYHGDLLDEDRRKKWMGRLAAAASFVYKKFPKVDTTNINYGATTMYALNLIGRILDNSQYIQRSRKLAAEVTHFFTEENAFLLGEIKPSARQLSKKGLPGIDLGYNVEESLNSIVLYALHENDEELLSLVNKSLNTHLEFMLPDGGWDNGWGTRMYKWSYWGSRTCDGIQPAFGMMAHYNPALGTAAFKNTELLKQCTNNGLLHGGPHYISRGIKPCVHHTFAHAKPLATMLDHWEHLPKINKKIPLPREIADGLKYYKEIDTSLFARGDWRGTITAYDAEYYHKKGLRYHATGGALSLLYHNKVGLLCTASMAIYKMVEVYNQQPASGEDIALTPRVETYKDDVWYTNILDLEAKFNSSDRNSIIEYSSNAQLKSDARKVVEGTAADFKLNYHCSEEQFEIIISTEQEVLEKTAFVLPIVSPNDEKVRQISSHEIAISKAKGLVKITSSVPLEIKEMSDSRTFNMVPGVEAVPIMAYFTETGKEVKISIAIQ